MTNYLNISRLPIIDFDLPKVKHDELDQLISNLKISDVENENVLNRTLNRIKDQILIRKVEFQEPKIKDNSSIIKDIKPHYDNPFGGRSQVYIVNVEIQFEGSLDLFNYCPNGYRFTSSIPPIIK